MSYWKFEPTDDRDFTLHVSDGLAYRDTMPLEDADDLQKALDLLTDAESMILDKTHWIPTVHEHEGGLSTYFQWILAVDKHGNRVERPASLMAERWTLLGAIKSASTRHYTPDSYRIALNAMQLTLHGWISLGFNHDDRRRKEQEADIIGLDDYIDDDMARQGHERCLSALSEAIQVLSDLLSPPSDESPDDDDTKSMRGATAQQVLSGTTPQPTEVAIMG